MPAAEAEAARARLLELEPSGFEEIESSDCLELAAYTVGTGERASRAAFGDVSAEPVEPGWEQPSDKVSQARSGPRCWRRRGALS